MTQQARQWWKRSLLAGVAAALIASAPAWAQGLGIPIDDMPDQMRDAYARSIQEELNLHGYNAGTIDGVIGPRTTRAIRTYQRDAGLTVNGIATKELLDHLKFALPKIVKQASVGGASYDAVDRGLAIAIQEELRLRGYYSGGIDGLVGPQTRSAIRRFQESAGLPVTGQADQALLDQLKSRPQASGISAI